MTQTNQIGTHRTAVFTDDEGYINVIYHTTAVFKYNPTDKKLILNSGGWNTQTTKSRINQACKQFNIPIEVYQKDFIWYINTNPPTLFNDNIIINL